MNRFLDLRQAAEACGEHIIRLLQKAIADRGRAMLAISGGNSPRPMFEYFARTGLDWNRVQLFWVDERGVPPTDPQSNFKMTNEAWLGPAKFPAANIHRILAERDAKEAASLYTDEVRRVFGIVPGDVPEFDVVHQGIGPDGHTASLFPGGALVDERHGIAGAEYVEKMKQWRISLLPAVLIQARHTAMLVSGRDKEQVLEQVLNGPYDPSKFPAQVVGRNARDVEWFLDF
jgi:6-phosphogluconolactonase